VTPVSGKRSAKEPFGAESVAAAAAPPLAIEVRGLRMSYGGRPVLSGVDFEVRAGEVFCLLGPNGAGKPVTELRCSFSCGKRPPCAE
jgi:ABC-type molybdenum transport system ATPase subunit/photorepair protein PhrA